MPEVAAIDTAAAVDALPLTLAGFRGRHRGQTIVVCGCGTSLKELEQPSRFVTIGVNDVGRLFDPTYLVVVNPRSQFSGDRFRYVEESRARAIFTQLDLGVRHPHVVRFGLGRRSGIDLDRDDLLDYTSNSPYVAALIALRMGAARIAVIGVDLTDDHFFSRTGRHPLQRRFSEIDQEYGRLAAAAAVRGVEIVNISSTSRLTSLRRIPAASLAADPGTGSAAAAPGTDAAATRPWRVFFVNYRFLACGDVFATGLARAGETLGIEHASAWWDDPGLRQKIDAFSPDLVFVVHGRRAASRWGAFLRERRSAVWLLDEPYEVDDTARWSSVFGTVFVNDPSTLKRHRQAHALSVCFDPELHHDAGVERDYQVGFVGGYNPVRERYLVRLAEEGLLSYVVGGPWKTAALERLRLSDRTTPEETACLYQRTRLVINVFRSVHHYNQRGTPGTSLNPRVFEALGCGAFVVSEPREALASTFPEVPTFRTGDELVETVRRLLADPSEIDKRLAASRARLAAESYAARLANVLETTLGAKPPAIPKEPITAMPALSRPALRIVPPAPAAAHVPQVVLPGGWEPVRGVSTRAGDAIRITAQPGTECGLATSARFDSAYLAFDVQLHGRCRLVAKIQHQEKGAVAANSYHLIATPERAYIARHDVVLASCRIARGPWQSVEMTWHEGVLAARINDREVCRVADATLPAGHAFVGVCDGSITIRNVRILAVPSVSTAPDGWVVQGPGTIVRDAGRLVLSASSGPVSLVSEAANNDVELECGIRLDPQAHFIAKLHHQSQENGDANSYHLVSQPSHGFLARHHQVFARAGLARGVWQRLRLRWVDQCLELFIDGRLRARLADNLLQSGYSVLALTAGRAEVRDLVVRDLSLQAAETAGARIGHGHPALPMTGATPPVSAAPIRNLLYHVWPVRGSMWRWNVEQLLRRIDLFNGRRIIGIVHDGRSEDPDEVREAFDGHGCEFVVAPNSPTGEGLTFPSMLRQIRSLDPDEVTFYAHAKGVKYEPAVPDPVRRWADAQYRVALDDWPTIREHLSRFALTGSFKMLGRFRVHHYAGDWHYSGTFFWLRHASVFGRDVERLPSFYGCVEAWPGIHFRREETGCLFMDNLRQLPYRPEFWCDGGDAALSRWIGELRPVVPPASLQTPESFEDGSGPRLEQHPSEFSWWLEQLVAAEPRSLLTIGSMHGGVEWQVAKRFRALGRGISITAVDLEGRPELLASLADARERFGQSLSVVVGDSTSAAAREQLASQYDAVFIDGDHTYRGAKSDLDFALSQSPRLVGIHDIVDSEWHAVARCCVSRVWREARAQFRTEERTTADWGGIGIVRP